MNFKFWRTPSTDADSEMADKAVLSELVERVDDYGVHSVEVANRRLDRLDKIEEWARTLPDANLRRAYKHWVPFFRDRLRDRVKDFKAQEYRRAMPKPPI